MSSFVLAALKASSDGFEYCSGVELPREQVINLYSQCRWSSAEKPDSLLIALSNSDTVISAWYGDNLIGLGNAISDKAFTHPTAISKDGSRTGDYEASSDLLR
jgi:hypothetical protein